MTHFGDYQNEIYFGALHGVLPKLSVDYPTLEARAATAMPPSLLSYVQGGCADETPQDRNAEAFSHCLLRHQARRGTGSRLCRRECVRVSKSDRHIRARAAGGARQRAAGGSISSFGTARRDRRSTVGALDPALGNACRRALTIPRTACRASQSVRAALSVPRPHARSFRRC